MSERTLRLVPERWLVVDSEAVWHAITEQWSEGAAPDSLTCARLRAGQVEQVDRERLPGHLAYLKGQGCQTIRIIMERFDADLPELLKDCGLEGLDLRAHVWREAPQDVMQTLAAPEDAILDAWAQARQRPVEFELAGPTLPRNWKQDFLGGMARWEAEARQTYGDAFAETYDRYAWPFGWVAALGERTGRSVRLAFEIIGRQGVPIPSDGGHEAGGLTSKLNELRLQAADGTATVIIFLPIDKTLDVLIKVRQPVDALSAIASIRMTFDGGSAETFHHPSGGETIAWQWDKEGFSFVIFKSPCSPGLRNRLNLSKPPVSVSVDFIEAE